MAREVPADHLLVETDCPWLAPQFRRGKRNEPAYVRSTAEKIAELRGVSLDEIGGDYDAQFRKTVSCEHHNTNVNLCPQFPHTRHWNEMGFRLAKRHHKELE